eukprot:CAMPEP_0185763386 /NCGR_PEP_ID=MMETSP1174-20130828/22321_1 /TAXON_ID=35687 /ORGANISM="Dictyocha speculum, Strain CCMP1381" /LENGTH=203 /DNA_ID=CAMNT_0028445479 /DNA_START=52 /DNA_END=664 /DNA_ORIENTATION=-
MGRTKIVSFLRHGQAAHNPRAEAARSAGCSWEEFMRMMKEDDHFNAPLTPLGRAQARTVHERLLAAQGVVGEEVPSRDTRPRGWRGLPPVDLIVSSPLGRALDTAVAVFPMETSRGPFIAIEAWRERSGWMVNSQRPTRSVLEEQYPICDFSDLASEEDAMWGEALEVEEAALLGGSGLFAESGRDLKGTWLWQHMVEFSIIC